MKNREDIIVDLGFILSEWEGEADLLESGQHPRRQAIPRGEALHEACAYRACVAVIRRLVEEAKA